MTVNYNISIKSMERGPSICQLPKSLKDTKPEVYTRVLGLGPFHHCRPELLEETLLLKRGILSSRDVNIRETILGLTDGLPEPFEERIYSCYGGYLDLDEETLKLIMVVDSICLLQLLHSLQRYNKLPDKVEGEFNVMIPDLMILENQIPSSMIQQALQHPNLKQKFPEVTSSLFDMFYDSISRLSPVKLADDDREYMRMIWGPPQHLLHFMHTLVVGRKLAVLLRYGKFPGSTREGDDYVMFQQLATLMPALAEMFPGPVAPAVAESARSNMLQQTADSLMYAGRQAREFFIQAVGEINSATTAAKTGGLRVPEWFAKTVQGIGKAVRSTTDHQKQATVLDEVHSVSELYDILKLTFQPLPVGCGFGNIVFDKTDKKIHLPIMSLDSFSEVILKNLLAFESVYLDSNGPKTEVRDHVGLLCAIIRNEKDVQLLKDAQVIETQLQNEDVVKLFKSIKESSENLPKKSSFLAAFAKYTNGDYENHPVVKACNWIKKWSLAFVNLVKRIWPLFVVLLLLLQTFCGIYDCRRGPWFRAIGETAGVQHLPLRDASMLSLDQQAGPLTPRKFLRYSS